MMLIDTKDIKTLLQVGVGSVEVHTAHRLQGSNGKITSIEPSMQIVGQRFTHVILSQQDLEELLGYDAVRLYNLLSHFKPENPNAN